MIPRVVAMVWLMAVGGYVCCGMPGFGLHCRAGMTFVAIMRYMCLSLFEPQFPGASQGRPDIVLSASEL